VPRPKEQRGANRSSPVEAAGLKDEQAREILYLLKLCRHVDERMEAMYRQGRLAGPIRSARGREGTDVGAAYALRADDSLFTAQLGAHLVKGVKLERAMATLWGRIDGYTRGRDALVCDWNGARTFTVVSTGPADTCPPAAGAAIAYRLRGEPRVAMAICGDGAKSSGRWHQALEASAAHRLPVVWVVNVSGSRSERGRSSVADRAAAYGMPCLRTDGSDVLDVYAAASEAAERARSGEGPTLLEAVASGDPVSRFTDVLLGEALVSQEDVKEIQAGIDRDFNQGYEFAQRSPLPDPTELTLGVFADDRYWNREPSRGEARA